MIKFLGRRDPAAMPVRTGPKPHPCTLNGLMPGSSECLTVDQVLSKQLPFVVVPFKGSTTKSAGSGSGSGAASTAKSAGAAAAPSKYVYTERPLKEGELSSIFELPPRFRYKPIDEAEVDAINQGIGTL